MLLGRGYSAAEATTAMMVAPDQEVTIKLDQNTVSQGSLTGLRVCNVSANSDYIKLKSLLLTQKICRFTSTATQAQRDAAWNRCPMMALAAGSLFTFAVYGDDGNGNQMFLTDVLAQRSWTESMDPLCISEFSAFCSEANNSEINSLAQTLVAQLSSLSTCNSPIAKASF